MLVSDNEEFIKKAKSLSTQARDPVPHYQHSQIGYNYRLSNLLAAVGSGQLARLDAKIARRKKINAFYKQSLGNLPGIEFIPVASYGTPNYWLTVILITPESFGADREGVRLALEAENIESRPIWMPMHLQPVFKHCWIRGGSVGEGLFASGLCLPSGTHMTDDDLRRITEIIKGCYKKHK